MDWRRRCPAPAATRVPVRAVVPAVAVASIDPSDPDADTVTDIRAEWPADAPGPARAERPGPPIGMLAVGVIGLALVALLALTSLLGDGDRGWCRPDAVRDGSSQREPLGRRDTVRDPSAHADPGSRHRRPIRLQQPSPRSTASMRRSKAWRHDEEIKKKDLDTIRKRAGEIRKALEAGNYGQARDRTARLSGDIAKIDDRAQGDAMEELKAAVSDLEEAIPAG